MLTKLVYLQWYIFYTFWRYLEEVLKISWIRLEDIFVRRIEEVRKTSSGHLEDILNMHDQGEYIYLDHNLLKTSWRHLLKTFDQGQYIRLNQDVFRKKTAKDVLNISSTNKCLLGEHKHKIKVFIFILSREALVKVIEPSFSLFVFLVHINLQ